MNRVLDVACRLGLSIHMKQKSVPGNRLLTNEEIEFVLWLLRHGNDRARSFVPQLEHVFVTGCCGCGCASVNLGVKEVVSLEDKGMETLCDYCWHDSDSAFFGVFLFARNGVLAGLDLWSIDGKSTATTPPHVSLLVPLV